MLCVLSCLTIFCNNVHAVTDAELCESLFESQKEAHLVCLRAANEGDAKSQYLVSTICDNEQDSLNWLKKSATQEYPYALKRLGEEYLDGLSIEKDIEKSEALFKSAFAKLLTMAEKEDIEAQIAISGMYKNGRGIPINLVQSGHWSEKAANSSSPKTLYRAQGYFNLGRIYFDSDIVKAERFFKIAFDMNSKIKSSVANFYFFLASPLLKENNFKDAEIYFQKAIAFDEAIKGRISRIYSNVAFSFFNEKNYTTGEQLLKIASVYDANVVSGILRTEAHLANNDDIAFKLFFISAELGNLDAQEQIGWRYKNGKGVKQNYIEAEKWFRKAANQGHASSQSQLGNLYYNGQGVDKDFSSAVHWYKKAADQGEDDAQYSLGNMYSAGEGVPKNYAEAVKWFQKSAEQGNTLGQWGLGAAYYNGEGVPADNVQALAWITLASVAHTGAVKTRDRIEKELKPNEINQAQQLAIKLETEIGTRLEQKYLAKRPNKATQQKTVKILFPSLTPAPTTTHSFTQNDIAIIIGIEKYRSVPPTEYAAADAGMVRDYLKALGIPERNIEFLADERATLSDIRKVIETKLPNMVKANSRVIVYYAGHGAPGTQHGEAYLVPFDGDPSYLADTAYPLSRLYDRLSRLKVKEILVVLDSCFSGSGGRSVLAKNARPLVMVKDAPPPTSKKMIVLTSSRGSQITTSLPETGHGAFTYFFLRALQEGNRDIGEVYAYLNPRVTEEAKRQNVDQTPTISPAAGKLKGRFLFVR